MKTRNVFAVVAILLNVAQAAPAASNDLSAALQKGLFEEEANHNFAEAIQAYQSVVSKFDEDRKLAGTAVFRLGEIYRKQGKTNEAYAQYERVLREFADQSQLVTLSQAYLAARGPTEIREGTTNGQPDLLSSIEAEEVKRIRAMIKDSPDLINAKEPQGGQTPLHRAAEKGQLVVAEFLLASGADLEAKDRQWNGRTPLHYGAMAGHKAMVELLLEKGANVQATDAQGYSAVHLAADKGFKNVLEPLLAHGADAKVKAKSGEAPLHLAIAHGFRSIAELLISKGADINAVASDVYAGPDGRFAGTPLHIAAARGDESLAQLLLAKGANIDTQDNEGRTPLFAGVASDSPAVVKLLLEQKANPEIGGMLRISGASNPAYKFPIHVAIERGNNEMLKLLLEHCANPNIESSQPGKSINPPLWDAVVKKQKAAVDLLLKAKADPNNMPRELGYSLLQVAASTGDEGIVGSLLGYKAKVDEPNSQGTTPLREAVNR